MAPSSGIEQLLGVERAFQPHLLVEIDGAEHRRHQITLLDPDAVFAGQHAADLNAEPQDVSAEFFRRFQFARLVGVIHDQGMQIAVASMKDIRHPQAIAHRHLGHTFEDQRQLTARDGAIHAVIIGRNAADGREGRLAAGPDQQAFSLGIADPDRAGAVGLGNDTHPLQQVIDLDIRPIQLGDQQGLGIERIAGMDEFLDCTGGRPVHHFQTGWNDPRRDDIGNALAAGFGAGKAGQQGARRFRLAQ